MWSVHFLSWLHFSPSRGWQVQRERKLGGKHKVFIVLPQYWLSYGHFGWLFWHLPTVDFHTGHLPSSWPLTSQLHHPTLAPWETLLTRLIFSQYGPVLDISPFAGFRPHGLVLLSYRSKYFKYHSYFQPFLFWGPYSQHRVPLCDLLSRWLKPSYLLWDHLVYGNYTGILELQHSQTSPSHGNSQDH